MTAPAADTILHRRLVTGAAVLASVSIFWMATETHYGQCVAAQSAKYPPVGVSAYNTRATGPLKVAYDAERRKAVNGCKRFLII